MRTTERILSDITDFLFIGDEPAPADAILIPGGAWPELPERAAEFYRAGYAPVVIPSGRFSYKRERFGGPRSKQDLYPGPYDTEWACLRDVLIKNGVPESAILREDASTNTYENAQFSKRAADEAGLQVKRAILCCKSFHARRCLMTYACAFPGAEFYIVPVETPGICRDTWFRTQEGREKVLSELEKCGSYYQDAVAGWADEL